MLQLRGLINLRALVTVICTASFLFLSACSNQVASPNKKTKKLSAGENSVFAPDNSTTFTLQTVAPNPFNSNVLNLVGDGSGDIGRYCIGTQSGGQTSYSCTCSFKYTRANGSTVDWIDTNILYREEDMLQCSRTIIHADAVTVWVRIHLVNSDSSSTSVQLNYQTVFGGDTSNALNLTDVHRYQCRDAVFAPLPLMASSSTPIYDPFLSDDPEISYPLNFYYTNRGAALSSFVANPQSIPSDASIGSSSVKVGWFCPSDADYTHSQNDLNLFSLNEYLSGLPIPPIANYDDSTKVNNYWTQLATAGRWMADPTSNAPQANNLRSDFVLSKKPSGAFSMPVVAYVAPNTINSRMTDTTSGSTGGLEPIGYGAVPTPKGDDQEACPTEDEAVIPAGYHWVKVWLARASLETRKTPVAEKFGQLPGLIQPPADANRELTQACQDWEGANSFDNQSYRINPHTGACGYPKLNFPAGPLGGAVSYRNTAAQSRFKGSPVQLGMADYWTLSTLPQNLVGPPAIAANYYTLATWIFGFMKGFLNPPAQIDFKDTDFSSTSGGTDYAVPLSEASYTPLEQSSRYDYLFVVTPTNIHSKHMIYPNTADYENYGKYFIPFRLKNSEYFGVGSCSPTSPQLCPESAKIHYDIKLHGVQYQGDAPDPITDPGRLPVFPVCALQKD